MSMSLVTAVKKHFEVVMRKLFSLYTKSVNPARGQV